MGRSYPRKCISLPKILNMFLCEVLLTLLRKGVSEYCNPGMIYNCASSFPATALRSIPMILTSAPGGPETLQTLPHAFTIALSPLVSYSLLGCPFGVVA